MVLEFVEIAVAAVKLVGPYLPKLLDAAKGARDVAEVLADTGGQAVQTVQKVWDSVKGLFTSDDEVKAAGTMVAAKPTDAGRQEMLAEVLAQRLQSNPALAEEIVKLLGGEKRVQEMTVGAEGVIDRVRQTMEGAGQQMMKAGEKGRLSNAVQEMKR